MTSIRCPKCLNDIPISEAITYEIESVVLEAERKKHLIELERLKHEAADKTSAELNLIKGQLADREKKLRESEAFEIRLRKDRLKLEDEKSRFEIEKAREIDRERELIRRKTVDEVEKRGRMEKLELEKKISDLKQSLEDAQKKASQGSQQLQGEVAELDLENTFRNTFTADRIIPVGKGVTGADIRQTVCSASGIECGTILWESKRTRSWSDSWIVKLKADLIAAKSDIPAIVSEALPIEAKIGIGFKDGVWIASPQMAIMLAALLRARLLERGRREQIEKRAKSKAEELYAYVTSISFQNQVESMVTTYRDMRQQIDRERSAYERSWKLREMQIARLMSGVAGLYGSIQGIAEKALPTIGELELESMKQPEQV